LRRLFVPKREEVAVSWRKFHEDLHNLHSSPYMTRHVVCMGEVRKAYMILVGSYEGKKSLGRPRRRWEGIKIDLGKLG
jgi:hypothetical protein